MIFDILDEKCCKVDLKARSKDEAVRKIAELAAISGLTENISTDILYEKLKEREDQGSTGFGNGVAIPHARIEGMKDFLLYIAVSSKGIEFEAMDKKKVQLFIIILGPPEKVNQHLKILASVSQTISKPYVKNELVKALSNKVLYESFIRNSRESESGSSKQRKMRLMYVILYVEDFLYNILEFFIQEGIDGATILESSGMGQYISNVPLFADFIGFMSENKNRSKTIMSIVPDEKVDTLIRGIEDITGDLNVKQGAMIITTDISFYKGSMKMM